MQAIQCIRDWGQSLWYDNLRRDLLGSGELARWIAGGISGVTANPTILEQAIVETHDYDSAIRTWARRMPSAETLYETLVWEDIRQVADLLQPVYSQTEGHDGFVSLEVPPSLAYDTAGTVREAHRLFAALDRPNIMIKVPATPEGIVALERLVADGINVNVTLIFSVGVYHHVIDAYEAGLIARHARGLPLDRVASVASFFVSRVDAAVDPWIRDGGFDSSWLGKVGIANAKNAYQLFDSRFHGQRFAPLLGAGAQVQRSLWASTKPKNHGYPGTMYVQSLIGAETVNTLSPSTLEALPSINVWHRTIDQNLEESRQILEDVADAGLSLEVVGQGLLEAGLSTFTHSFDRLLATLQQRLSQRSNAHGEGSHV